MLDYLWLINIRLLLSFNHWLASHEQLYLLGVLLTDKLADVLTLATFGLMWFWPQSRETPYFLQVLPDAQTGLRSRITAALRATYWRWITSLSRIESRAQFLVLAVAGVCGYITARLVAFQLDLDRPFATYLDVRAPVEGAFEDLRIFGSFPSDHAVLLAMLPVALLYWDRGLAFIWLLLGLFLIATRVAVGFHYPVDMLGGAAIGVLYAGLFMSLYRRNDKVQGAANLLARSFNLSNSPYCYLLYFLAFIIGVEFLMHFEHTLETIFTLRAEVQEYLD